MSFTDRSPRIDDSAWIAPGAVVCGDVALGARASIWFGCVVRADLEPIVIGEATNVQDLTMVHVDHGLGCTIGRRVTIGHRCIVHACEVGDDALIGMGAVLLSGCKIGAGALVAAGAVVREGFEVPPGKVAAGVPAVIKGDVDEAMAARMRNGTTSYIATAKAFADGRFEHAR